MKDIDTKIEKAADATAKVLDEVTALSDEYGVQPELVWDILATLLDRADICCCGHRQEEDGCEISCEDDEDEETAEEDEDECPAEKKFYQLKTQYMNMSTDAKGGLKLPPDVLKGLEADIMEKGDGENVYVYQDRLAGEIHLNYYNPKPCCYYKVKIRNLKTGALGTTRLLGKNNHNVTVEVYEDGEVLIY